ncbi:MAG: 1-(5-phosphoribosyl)-5-[(5-phosphoribosylamino)methylideneamino] imidazole-4-carboxamide isomerase [Cytophagales bacterium]|nr:1-(5-phosphoribosyl)-5-[(5-phosphoribosylamino)methylideneamino] imidazole-4-carboxamide isomerase [Bernardetiaceae bacterium]MDW8210007.1 1-(5-phosphoribosyl)-5-[(5-phosphoribosylamino)methylideneamino] imidazole-4-carboxamide isomerase [Cytophagales bacterium]
MIELVPSMTILGGKCVRLKQGNYEDYTTYKVTPLELAQQFEEHGVRRLHLIDLDGARAGRVINYEVLGMITRYTSIEVDFGGGISNDGEASTAFDYGAKMITVGSIAVYNPNLVNGWLVTYGRNRVILSADVMAGNKIAVTGRQKQTDVDLFEFVEQFYEQSLLYLKCSSNEKDGMMEGPDFELYKQLISQFPDLRIMASGGISSMDDIKKLEELGVYAAVIGKAFYEGRITLKDFEKFYASAQ